MAREVIWADHALDDLRETVQYIGADSPENALPFGSVVFDRAADLAEFPERGRMVPEFEDPELREVIIGNYRLMYEIHDREVQVIAFVHGARLLSIYDLERRR